jgi:hypothetical protein
MAVLKKAVLVNFDSRDPRPLCLQIMDGVWRALPDVGEWAPATLHWTGAGLVTLCVDASRGREGRRA